ncbi:hypothetical protein [Pseudomonas gingeri]|uniref:hypothetical protein n=1 Tax=Pseudomonas gingeri TaxID=117681 RepID=UPI0015A4C792|nr:hypothetical protein [Pseudomonas gingeri]NVZ66979.1 hypothetical protein [Pseudomonas gingeri]NWD04097.1 hypothetical protein [Pseudomonas gingeri]NWE33895.1 hypothetical protein [Pseudomonas gingeri]NWE58019.1 hypothetical protein [Pseudomonas gingeri]NWF04378.1 hypothetical protein [Pseudomonas gingeri]
MSKSSPVVVQPDPETGQAVSSDAIEAASSIGPPRGFRDKLYTSRTLVMPDGRTLSVAHGRVYAVDDDQYAFLKAHPDIEPLE